jgi:fructose-specific phosphotransferase system IIC component
MTKASAWRAPLVAAICLVAAGLISHAPLAAGLQTALILGLAAFAIGISLAQTMGLRQASRGIRAIILLPLVFCVVATVVLMLESWFRAGQVLR